MYYSVTFSRDGLSKNTWADWYLVPSSRPVIAPPKPKTVKIDIPGSNGDIDLTESLFGDVTYENRTGSIEFIVMNDKPVTWYDLYSDIMNFLHGRNVQLYFEEEPDIYYEGRVQVDGWESEPDYSRITIYYDLYPFKLDKNAFSETITLSGSNVNKNYTTGRMNIVPKFTTVAGVSNVSIIFKGTEYKLSSGENVVPSIVFKEGTNSITYKGTGPVTITYRGGSL